MRLQGGGKFSLKSRNTSPNTLDADAVPWQTKFFITSIPHIHSCKYIVQRIRICDFTSHNVSANAPDADAAPLQTKFFFTATFLITILPSLFL